MLDDISNRWGFRDCYYGRKEGLVLAAKMAVGMLALALAIWGVGRLRGRSRARNPG
jgi:hypothetical protein